MTAKYLADTNLLVYAFDSSEPVKQATAQLLIDKHGRNGDLMVSIQVLQEFFNVVTRKLKPSLSIEDAYEVVKQFSTYPIVQITPELILHAISRHRDDSFSFWDALIVEAALHAGCQTLLSEDLQDGRQIGSMVISNPFKTS